MNLKEFFLESGEMCLESGIVFNNSTKNSNYYKFIYNLKKYLPITPEEYYVKYVLNGIEPKCKCGCNIKPRFFKGKFHKYYLDHKNKMVVTEETILKIKKRKIEKGLYDVEKLINRTNLTVEQLKKGYNEFINLEKPMSQISNELFVDFRTLKSYWDKLGLIEDKDAFKRLNLKSKITWISKPLKPNNSIIEHLKNNVLVIKAYLKDKKKVTFDELNSLLKIDINKNYLSWFLKDNLNSTELKKIKFVKISQIEVNFLNVLKFYFGNKVKGSYEVDGKIFDYKLGKKILIELDGEYWHSKEAAIKNDKLKNIIAKENDYVLIRVSDIEVKNIKFINKIKKLYEKFK